MTQLIIIRGLPGAGKSTLANQICNSIQSNNSLWEADMFFERDGEYKFDRSRIGEAHEWCKAMVDHDLEYNFAVVVANTFTTKKELRPYFEMAKKYCIVPQVILCQGDWDSIHNVPQQTLEAMKARFEYDISALYKIVG
jgi:predicted kinase